MIELENTFELCDIERLKNLQNTRFTSRQIMGLALFNVDWNFFFQMFCKSLFTKQIS